ncbi:YceI family protein [Streptomyces montanisoli]|uniref:YceI family protein n=1 Tax=Streptomyces montanisoli TaxID=2798581 RepID=A0A940MKC1_9ACTN|nr:YceI family protein [Streptomyces montanisoli]MBP0461352.1 YceI family protein [Streptomyces montanisoli]
MPETNPRQSVAELTGAWLIDPARTRVSFTLRKLGVITVKGTLPVLDGRVDCAPGGVLTGLTARLDATGFESGNPQRDKDVKGKRFLDTANHPELRYTATSAAREAGGWRVSGQLTVRGRTAPQDLFVADAPLDGTAPTLRATAVVDRTAMGVTAMRGVAGRLLRIDIEAVLTAAP